MENLTHKLQKSKDNVASSQKDNFEHNTGQIILGTAFFPRRESRANTCLLQVSLHIPHID